MILYLPTVSCFPANPGTVNTMRSLYHEYGKGSTAYLRIIRVYHGTSIDGSGPQRRCPNLAYRTFAPATLRMGGTFSVPVFELQSENLKRMQAWLNHTGKGVNSLWPSDAICHHGYQWSLVQVLAHCLTAPSHCRIQLLRNYIHQHWPITAFWLVFSTFWSLNFASTSAIK